MTAKRGNCYAASEALWHILGGKESKWKVMRISPKALGDLVDNEGTSHWFLQHETGVILDPSRQQYNGKLPDYSKAVRAAFFPTQSFRSKTPMNDLTWRLDRA